MIISMGYIIYKLNRKLARKGQKISAVKLGKKYLISLKDINNGMTEIFFKEKVNVIDYLVDLI